MKKRHFLCLKKFKKSLKKKLNFVLKHKPCVTTLLGSLKRLVELGNPNTCAKVKL